MTIRWEVVQVLSGLRERVLSPGVALDSVEVVLLSVTGGRGRLLATGLAPAVAGSSDPSLTRQACGSVEARSRGQGLYWRTSPRKLP